MVIGFWPEQPDWPKVVVFGLLKMNPTTLTLNYSGGPDL